jgi:hypothetical protein
MKECGRNDPSRSSSSETSATGVEYGKVSAADAVDAATIVGHTPTDGGNFILELSGVDEEESHGPLLFT